MQSAMNRGGTIGFAKGLSLARGAFRVTMTACGVVPLLLLDNAFSTSSSFVGVPWIMCNPLVVGREEGFRTRAVIV